jgi:hypothetical protein
MTIVTDLAPSLATLAGGPKRRTRLLNRVAADPLRALDDRRCLKPAFCHGYFDLCDDLALRWTPEVLERPDQALRHARVGVDLAEITGNPHLVHLALGVLAHAHLALGQRRAAREVLEGYRNDAARCCSSCHGDWLRRQGDYQVEMHDGGAAREDLERSLRRAASPDSASRIRFLNGIALYHDGDRIGALEHELDVLASLELTSPQGYLIDALAILAIILRGAEPAVDARVREHLERFQGRLAGLGDATDLRYRMAWVEGQLLAGHDVRTALERLDGARLHLFEKGPLRHAIAVSLDLTQIYCRRDHEAGLEAAKRVLARCLRRLPEGSQGQDGDLRKGVEDVAEMLPLRPENAVDALAELRSSFVVSVPGIVAERLTLRW